MRNGDFTGLRAGQREELIDHPRQFLELFKLTCEDAPVLFGGAALDQGDFRLAAQNGQGSSQFMRNAGRKLLHFVDGFFKTSKCLIELNREIVEFVTSPSYRKPLMQVCDADLSGSLT